MATELVRPENKYQAAFHTLRQTSPAASWVELVRGSAMDRFELLGFPSVKEEEWKYTNLAPLAKESFQPAAASAEVSRDDVERFRYAETAGPHTVLVNSFMRADLWRTPRLSPVVRLDPSRPEPR